MARGVDFKGEGNAVEVVPAASGLTIPDGDLTVTTGSLNSVGMTLPTGDLTVTAGEIVLGGVQMLTGTANTRAAVRADGGDAAGIGSVYLSTDGGATTAPKVYFKIADATADADWERLVTAAAD